MTQNPELCHKYNRSHARTHAHTYTRTHTRTHTHTLENKTIKLPLKQNIKIKNKNAKDDRQTWTERSERAGEKWHFHLESRKRRAGGGGGEHGSGGVGGGGVERKDQGDRNDDLAGTRNWQPQWRREKVTENLRNEGAKKYSHVGDKRGETDDRNWQRQEAVMQETRAIQTGDRNWQRQEAVM